MHSPDSQTGRELFLVLQNLSRRFHHFKAQLLPLARARQASLLSSVSVFYERDKDVALLSLAFDARELDHAKCEALIRLATQGGIPIIDPDRLNIADRRTFYQDYLRRYAVSASDKKSLLTALDTLGKHLGLIATPDEAPSRNRHHRLQIPVGQAQPQPQINSSGPHFALGPAGKTPHPASQHLPGHTNDLLPTDEFPQRARGKNKRKQRLSTVPAGPAAARRASSPNIVTPPQATNSLNSPAPTMRAPARRFATASTAPSARIADPAEEQELVRVRFQRGDKWMPARLRNLSTKEVRLAASAAPPSGSMLRVSITIGDQSAVVSGTVVEVVNTEGSVDGSTSFRLAFGNLSKRERGRIVNLLRKAHRAGLSLSAPPARRERRFSISWPIAVMSDGHRFNAAALDVSERGLFLATTTLIHSSQVVFGMPLDRDGQVIKGRAAVVRKVNESMARRQGLSLGYGLQIEDLSIEDDEQYSRFLVRVRRRSQKHIVVAGSSERSALLADCFQASGYAVSKASSVDTLLHQTELESNAPDVAVIDDTALSVDARMSFESTFRHHHVPMLQMHGESLPVARNSLDQLIAI